MNTGLLLSRKLLHTTIPMIKLWIDNVHNSFLLHVTILAKREWIIKEKKNIKSQIYREQGEQQGMHLKVDTPRYPLLKDRSPCDLWYIIYWQLTKLSSICSRDRSCMPSKKNKHRGSLHTWKNLKALWESNPVQKKESYIILLHIISFKINARQPATASTQIDHGIKCHKKLFLPSKIK